jgi:hypothetical protein
MSVWAAGDRLRDGEALGLTVPEYRVVDKPLDPAGRAREVESPVVAAGRAGELRALLVVFRVGALAFLLVVA